MPMDQGVHWKMERSSVFAAESLFSLRAANEKGKGLTTTHAEIEGSLLVALGTAPDQPVVFPELTMKEDRYLEWKGKQNCYANFDKLADWQSKYVDEKSTYGPLMLPKFEEGDRADNLENLWQATPEWFKLSEADQLRLNGSIGLPAEVEQLSSSAGGDALSLGPWRPRWDSARLSWSDRAPCTETEPGPG
jgi:hypothetical protein